MGWRCKKDWAINLQWVENNRFATRYLLSFVLAIVQNRQVGECFLSPKPRTGIWRAGPCSFCIQDFVGAWNFRIQPNQQRILKNSKPTNQAKPKFPLVWSNLCAFTVGLWKRCLQQSCAPRKPGTQCQAITRQNLQLAARSHRILLDVWDLLLLNVSRHHFCTSVFICGHLYPVHCCTACMYSHWSGVFWCTEVRVCRWNPRRFHGWGLGGRPFFGGVSFGNTKLNKQNKMENHGKPWRSEKEFQVGSFCFSVNPCAFEKKSCYPGERWTAMEGVSSIPAAQQSPQFLWRLPSHRSPRSKCPQRPVGSPGPRRGWGEGVTFMNFEAGGGWGNRSGTKGFNKVLQYKATCNNVLTWYFVCQFEGIFFVWFGLFDDENGAVCQGTPAARAGRCKVKVVWGTVQGRSVTTIGTPRLDVLLGIQSGRYSIYIVLLQTKGLQGPRSHQVSLKIVLSSCSTLRQMHLLHSSRQDLSAWWSANTKLKKTLTPEQKCYRQKSLFWEHFYFKESFDPGLPDSLFGSHSSMVFCWEYHQM